MLNPVAFWDASALIPLCVTQPHTPQAVGYFSRYRVMVWWATHVEMTSAFVRLLRSRDITEAEYSKAKYEAERLANLWEIVEQAAKVAIEAHALLERYPLRAADALQLAAAHAWCGGRPNERVFLTFDRRLGEAAQLAGFSAE